MFTTTLLLALLSPTAARIPTRTTASPGMLSRRAAIGGLFSGAVSMVPRAADALSDTEQLAADETRLAIEKESIRALDTTIRALRETRFNDELREQKDNEMSLDFLLKGDKATASKLVEEAAALAMDEKKLGSEVATMMLAEEKEAALERALEVKVANERAALSAKEKQKEAALERALEVKV